MHKVWQWTERRYPHLASRPLLCALPAFFAGLLATYSPLALAWVALTLLLNRRALPISLILLTVGFIRAQFTPQTSEMPIGEQTFVGRVINTPSLTRSAQTFLLQTESATVLVTARARNLLSAGDLIELRGSVRPIVEYSDSKTQQTDRQWLRRGVRYRCSAFSSGSVQVLEPGGGFASLGSTWRTKTWNILREHLDQDRAALAMGVVAGQQSLVTPETIEAMQKAGTLHMLATSGYNVMLFVLCVVGLLSLLPIHRSLQVLIACLVLLVYVAAVGGKPPILRASISAAIMLSAFLFRKNPDMLSALAASSVVCALVDPAAVFDIGYHLTFVILLFLCLYGGRMNDFILKWRSLIKSRLAKLAAVRIAQVFGVTIICQLAAAPLLAAHFGTVSLIAPVANVITFLSVPVIYVGVFLAQLLDPLLPSASQFVSQAITGPGASWMASVNQFFASAPGASASFTPIPGWIAVSLYALAALLSRPHVRTHFDEEDAKLGP
ncbi:MAG: ComEC/Rec2 family competence protein [Fimbriimonadales bacterium]